MKLTFKDLKQQKFTIEAEPTETIGELKEKIKQEKEWDPAQQKLIYSGKILKDADTIASYNIEEKGFIVCMVQKPKAPAASASAAPSTPAPSTARTPAAPAAPAPPTAPATSNPPATPSPAPQSGTAQDRSFNDPSNLALGEERAAAIANMEAMGFPRDQIDRAMRAAFFNPDRAVEYLLSGIPANLDREERPASGRGAAPAAAAASPSPAPAAATTAAPESTEDEPINLFEAAANAARPGTRGSGGAAGGAGGGAAAAAAGAAALGGAGTLDFLRNNPQFQQLRQMVQQQPQMLEPILQQLASGNPGLAQMIASQPEQFMQLLAEDGEDDAALPPGATSISVTEEEREAIERLCNLGFERDLVIQAYFACDKNEELAANFLFEQPEDED